MSKKSPKIADLIAARQGCPVDAHYLGFFDCFNRALYFEAHEVLEELWLEDRAGPNGAFYKGLIQLAGAFVHLQKSRPGPGAALLRMAALNLKLYPTSHQYLNLAHLREFTELWLTRIVANGEETLGRHEQPNIQLSPGAYGLTAEEGRP